MAAIGAPDVTAVADALAGALEPDALQTGWPDTGTAVVVAPRTAREVAAALALASRRRWATRIAGAGTWLPPGAPRFPPDLVVSAARLDDVAGYVAGDLTISAGAGMTLAALARITFAHGQWLALDPPGRPEATLGAVFATASAGPLRLGYGTPRDHVLGLELITGDGRILKLGGNVMKNVAGYDLVRLVVGSRGRLGLIHRLHLRLRALPERDLTLAIPDDDWPALVDHARRLRALGLELAAMELVGPRFWAAAPAELAGRWALVIRLHGNRDGVAAAAARIAEGTRAIELDGDAVWPSLAAREAGAAVVVRLVDRPSQLARTLARACALCPEEAIAAHAGDGIVRIAAEELPTDLAGARAGFAGTIAVAGAGLVTDPRMDQIVRVFDPAGILASHA